MTMEFCIGLDSFDTPLAGCTTHAASLILIEASRHGAKLVGYPVLIRLNPSIPWKTRGNGAVALRFKVIEANSIIKSVEKVVEGYGAENSQKAALLIIDCKALKEPCITMLYKKAVTSLVLLEDAKKCLDKLSPYYIIGENKHGIIGAIAALAGLTKAINEETYELIAYRHPREWLTTKRSIDERSVIEFDLRYKPLTFLNYDYKNKKILVAPHGLDPVLYGIRAETPKPLYKAPLRIKTMNRVTHWTLFKTNQATNAHLSLKELDEIRPYDNIIVDVFISDIVVLPGSHVAAKIHSHNKDAWAIAFRETGGLRRALQLLGKEEYIKVRLAGAVKIHDNKLTINIEYLDIPYSIIKENLYRVITLNTVMLKDAIRVLPDASAFHHLMMPWERYILKHSHVTAMK